MNLKSEFIENHKEIGYIYQVIVRVPENLPEKDILVQVTGAGELAGIDNGDLSDLTPYTANYRKTVDGKLVIYIKRMATGKINVAVREVIAEKSNVLAKINI
ncbi:MAG: hypothetical protein IJJ65_01260 [Butyrivibrio sp.]|nr:hypothetical protein [Butyrivibrio sp.]